MPWAIHEMTPQPIPGEGWSGALAPRNSMVLRLEDQADADLTDPNWATAFFKLGHRGGNRPAPPVERTYCELRTNMVQGSHQPPIPKTSSPICPASESPP